MGWGVDVIRFPILFVIDIINRIVIFIIFFFVIISQRNKSEIRALRARRKGGVIGEP
jgi:hypothetical protein